MGYYADLIKAKQKPEALQITGTGYYADLLKEKYNYDENQPRDKRGRWTDKGGTGGAKTEETEEEKLIKQEKKKIKAELVKLGYSKKVVFSSGTQTISKTDEAYIDRYKDIIDGKEKESGPIELGQTPQKLIEGGANDLPLKIMPAIIAKAQNKKNVGHDLDKETLKKIPELLYNPIAILESRKHKGSIVVITEARDKNNAPVIVAIKLNNQRDNNIINEIRSIHGRSNFDELFGYSLCEGRLIKIDIEKAVSLPKSYRAVIAQQTGKLTNSITNI